MASRLAAPLRLGLASLSACYAALLLGVIAHEFLGHALVVILYGGRLLSVEVSPLLYGLTRSEGLAGAWPRAILDFSGLAINALIAALALVFVRKRKRLKPLSFVLTWLVAGQGALIAATLFQGLVFGAGDAARLRGFGVAWRVGIGAVLALGLIAVLAWLARRLTRFLADQIGEGRSQGARVLAAALAYGLPLAPMGALVLPLPSLPGHRGLWVRLVLGGLIFAAGAALGLRPLTPEPTPPRESRCP